MSGDGSAPIVVHGWTIYAHPLFLAQLETLARQVEELRRRDPRGYLRKNPTRRLAAIVRLAFDVVPGDPARPEFRQGDTLGDEHRHWFRAKFFQRYRLFFRFHAASRVIVYAWVNDEDTRRSYESADDAYRVFRRMLERGRPPDDWAKLLAEASTEGDRLRRLVEDTSS